MKKSKEKVWLLPLLTPYAEWHTRLKPRYKEIFPAETFEVWVSVGYMPDGLLEGWACSLYLPLHPEAGIPCAKRVVTKSGLGNHWNTFGEGEWKMLRADWKYPIFKEIAKNSFFGYEYRGELQYKEMEDMESISDVVSCCLQKGWVLEKTGWFYLQDMADSDEDKAALTLLLMCTNPSAHDTEDGVFLKT